MEYIEIYVTAVGTIIVVLGVTLSMTKECKGHIQRMYERFDEHKEEVSTTHVSKEVFQLVHKHVLDSLSEIRLDVKALLKRVNDERA